MKQQISPLIEQRCTGISLLNSHFPSEIKNRTVVRKSLHTKRALRKGHLISEDDLIPLRPATGINPMEISTVLGCELKSDLSKSELISWKNLKKK